MKHGITILSFLLGMNVYSQHKFTNNNFFTYFDLMNIVENQFHSQLLISASMDEIGFNGEYYFIGKNFFSLNTSLTYKKTLPNIGKFWKPQTTEWAPYLPENGLMFSLKGKGFFNKRKFLFAGIKLSAGYLWTTDQKWPSYIGRYRSSPMLDQIFWVNNFRYGLDAIAGRKFASRFLSEISVELGYRFDQSSMVYQCASNCSLSPTTEPIYLHQKLGLYHFQVIMAFDL